MAVALAPLRVSGGELELPHRRGARLVDGSLGDWSGPALAVSLAEPELPAPQANQGTFRATWDERTLHFAFDVRDAEVFVAPPDCPVGALYQYDSVELYLDARGNRSDVMDQDDFQFVLTADGRYAVYRGDPILATAQAWQVPKSLQASLVIDVAARRSEQGYVVEGAIPLSAVGILAPVAGQELALDVSWNDWTEDHAPFPLMDFTVENLVADEEPEYSEAQAELAKRAYWPWSWSGSRDLGYPSQFTAVHLAGSPAFGEKLEGGSGRASLALAGLSVGVLIAGLLLLASGRRQRRRAQRLMREIERQGLAEEEPPPAPPDPALASADPGPSLVTRVEETLGMDLSRTSDHPLPEEDLVVRSVATIRRNLRRKLTVGELASDVAASTRTLQRAFKERLGCTPGELIVAIKMREARKLLQQGKRVAQVACELGYDDPNHFSRRFKSYCGKPPSHFREQG